MVNVSGLSKPVKKPLEEGRVFTLKPKGEGRWEASKTVAWPRVTEARIRREAQTGFGSRDIKDWTIEEVDRSGVAFRTDRGESERYTWSDLGMYDVMGEIDKTRSEDYEHQRSHAEGDPIDYLRTHPNKAIAQEGVLHAYDRARGKRAKTRVVQKIVDLGEQAAVNYLYELRSFKTARADALASELRLRIDQKRKSPESYRRWVAGYK